MLESLTYVTSNPGKAKQISRYLDFPILHKDIDLDEIQSLDGAVVVEHKAREAYKHVRSPILVEDTSLQFLSLGRLPGPLIKWFLTELGTDGLCKLLNEGSDRSALASAYFGLYDGQSLHVFVGAQEGSIALAPRGNNGFGWDSIFIPNGFHRTWAEMTNEESQETYMRIIALKKLEAYLKTT